MRTVWYKTLETFSKWTLLNRTRNLIGVFTKQSLSRWHQVRKQLLNKYGTHYIYLGYNAQIHHSNIEPIVFRLGAVFKIKSNQSQVLNKNHTAMLYKLEANNWQENNWTHLGSRSPLPVGDTSFTSRINEKQLATTTYH